MYRDCDYDLSPSERSLITCATGLAYKKKHYRNYLYLDANDKHMAHLIQLKLVQERTIPNPLDQMDNRAVYFRLTEEGIKQAYKINGYKAPTKIDVNL